MANTHSLDLERDSSQYAAITDASQTGLDITTGTYTFMGWFKFESLPDGGSYTNNRMFLTKDEYGTGGSANRSYTWYLTADRKLYLDWQNASGVTTIASNNAPFTTSDTGKWYHLAVTFDIANKTGNHYVNGSAVASSVPGSAANSIRNGAAPFAIGCQFSNSTPTPVQCFDGLIDDIRIFNTIKSEAQIAASMSSELAGTEDNLVAYWNLNNNYLDLTANNNDLTAANSPVFSTDVPFVESTGHSKNMVLLGVS